MSTKISVLLCVAVLLALTVACVFCPVIASAEDPSEYFPTYSSPFLSASVSWTDQSVADVCELIDKAYRCNLFMGGVPMYAYLETTQRYITIVYAVSVQMQDGTTKPDLNRIYYEESQDRMYAYSLNGNALNLSAVVLMKNGTFVVDRLGIEYSSNRPYKTPWYLDEANLISLGIWDTTTQSFRVCTAEDDFSVPTIFMTNGTESVDFSQIIGAYDQILAGSTVGGDGYDDGYSAGYDDGYGVGWSEGIQTGYIEGNADGYEAGYETGYDDGHGDGFTEGWTDGRDEGLEIGKDLGYREGYDDGFDTGYETGYWEGWDDGYDDGYIQGDRDATSYTIDIPSVITSVPQSAKAIINNAFGFEIFGINIAGLLSVLLIVAIIGFVVRWLMSR